MKTLVQGFNTAAQNSNPGPLSRESEPLPLSHCALRCNNGVTIRHTQNQIFFLMNLIELFSICTESVQVVAGDGV